MVCLFKKTADVSVDRQSRRTIARTPPPAFLFPDQRFQRPKPEKPAKPFNARSRRRRCLTPLIFRVNQFFLKNFFNTPEARRPRRRRLSKESRTSSQQGFSTFSEKLETEAPPSQIPPGPFPNPAARPFPSERRIYGHPPESTTLK